MLKVDLLRKFTRIEKQKDCKALGLRVKSAQIKERKLVKDLGEGVELFF